MALLSIPPEAVPEALLVNAANAGGLGGGGVDAAVNARGGAELKAARNSLPQLPNGVHR